MRVGLSAKKANPLCFFILTTLSSITCAKDLVIEETYVTAQKIKESLQDIPVAVSAVSGDTMRQMGMLSVPDALITTPGATFTSYSKTQQQLSIRGISSSEEGAASDSSTLMLVDGVVIARAFAYSANMFDVERVEVLRGPQGTLYGKNSVGGLVHVITKKPTEEVEGFFETSVGDYNSYTAEGALSGPLSDKFSARVAFHADQRDGYTEDVTSGEDLDSVENHSIRAHLMINVSDSLSVLLSADYAKDNDGATPRKPINDELYTDFFSGYTDTSSDAWTVDNSDGEEFYLDRKIQGASAEVTWDFSDYTLTSLTAFRDAENVARVDNFGSPFPLLFASEENSARQWSQEFRIDNARTAEALRWQAGLYALFEHVFRIDARSFVEGDPAETLQSSAQENEVKSGGVFGQGTYNFTSDTSLTLGVRYTSDEKDFKVFNSAVGNFQSFLLDEPVIDIATTEKWEKVTGVITLDQQVTESSFIYATISQGYKSGGFNAEASTNALAVTPYDPEVAVNYELGTKTEWFDRRLRFNASVFHIDYDDIQVERFQPSGTVIIDNAGKATIDGVELESTVLVTENLTLMGSYSYLDSVYDEYFADELSGDDYSGNRLSNSPKWTATLAAVYEYFLQDGSTIQFRADYRGRSNVFQRPDENPDQLLDDVEKYSVRLAWISSESDWEVAAWVRNLTNQAEKVNVSPQTVVTLNPGAVYAAPRTYGVTVKYSYF